MREAQERLERLQSERARMQVRSAEIEAEINAVNVEDAEAAVEEISAMTLEHSTIKRVAAGLDQKIRIAEAELEAAKERERLARVAELKAEYGEAVAGVAQATRALQTRLDKAEAVRRNLRAAGDRSTNWIPRQLLDAPALAEKFWTGNHVMAAGADPRPTKAELDAAKAEAARRSAEASLRRQAELLREAERAGMSEQQARQRLEAAKARAQRHGVNVGKVLAGQVTERVREAVGV